MARRKSDADRTFDDIRDVFQRIPWWVGPPVILIIWVLIAFIVPYLFTVLSSESGEKIHDLAFKGLTAAAKPLAILVALLLTLIWLAALVMKFKNAARLDRQSGLDSIRTLSWRDFEQLLAEAFRRQGYMVRDTGPGADGGVDLILEKDGQRVLVQAKQWKSRQVGVKIVRELLGVQVAERAHGSFVVTSGQATDEARRFGKKSGVRIIEGPELEEMIGAVQRRRKAEPAQIPRTPVQSDQPVGSAGSPPECPACGASMKKRVAMRGPSAGSTFWGCSTYPSCRATKPFPGVACD
ncbi:MAG: restriction endonuclease [Phycisphaeraceae bacterium]|nr:MAG: restriction endonuclease [Phycisphaeraceae bacterium]